MALWLSASVLSTSLTFMHVRKTAKSDYYLRHVRPFVCAYGTNRFPLGGFHEI